MEEARTIIRRLERIEELRGRNAPAAVLLTEVRQLLREGEAWVAAERGGEQEGAAATAGAADALASCRARIAAEREVMLGTTETAAL